jgi:hypothetical protein
MFRYSIRELMLFMLAFGLSLGWWLDHRSLSTAKLEAAEDARMLSWLTLPGRIGCGMEFGYAEQIREKYGARPLQITPSSWEGIDTEQTTTDDDRAWPIALSTDEPLTVGNSLCETRLGSR